MDCKMILGDVFKMGLWLRSQEAGVNGMKYESSDPGMVAQTFEYMNYSDQEVKGIFKIICWFYTLS